MPVLRGITWDHPRGAAPLAAASRRWGALHPEAEIRWDRRSLWAFGEAGLETIAREYDLIVIDHPFIGTAAEAGLLEPLDKLGSKVLTTLQRESVGPSFQSYAYEGHQWALPIDASGQAAAWRPDRLEAIGATVPSTWDEVIALGSATGVVALPLAPIDALCSFFTLCATSGSPPAASGAALTEPAAGIAALERLLALVDVVDPICFARTPITILDTAASTDEIGYIPLSFAYSNHSRTGFAPHRLTFGAIPDASSGGSTLGGAGIAVSARSTHLEDAVAFAAWIADAEQQRTIYVRHDGQPASRAAWLDSEANDLTNGFFRSLLATFDRAYLRPNRPGFAAFQSEAAPQLHDALRHRRPAAETLAALASLYVAQFSAPSVPRGTLGHGTV